MEEKEISLIDLMWEILLHWRTILICMLILGVLMGGYSYKKSYDVAVLQKIAEEKAKEKLSKEELSAQMEQIAMCMKEEEQEDVRSLILFEKSLADSRHYYENSVWMNLDPTALPRMDMVYGVVAEEPGKEEAIISAYSEILQANAFLESLVSQRENRTAGQLGELIQVVISESGETTATDSLSMGQVFHIDMSGIYMSDERRVLHVAVYEEDEVACRELAEDVEKQLNSLDMSAVYGEYELILLSTAYNETMDASLMDRQIIKRENMVTIQSNARKVKDKLSSYGVQYYTLLKLKSSLEENGYDETSISEELGSVADYSTVKGRISFKYVLLGMIAGAFLYILLLFVIYILNNKLRYTDDFSGLYGVPLLGQVPSESGSRKLLGFIDRWLLSLKNGGKRQFSRKDALHLAAVAVKLEASKEGFSTLYCVGCELQDGADQVCRYIAEELKKDSITVKSLNNVLYDAEAREKLQDTNAVVLVEKSGVSMYREVADELELLKRQKIAVLGSIVVE